MKHFPTMGFIVGDLTMIGGAVMSDGPTFSAGFTAVIMAFFWSVAAGDA